MVDIDNDGGGGAAAGSDLLVLARENYCLRDWLP